MAGETPPGAAEGTSGYDEWGRDGLNPPNGEYIYRFLLHALNAPLDFGASATEADLKRAVAGYIVAEMKLARSYVSRPGRKRVPRSPAAVEFHDCAIVVVTHQKHHVVAEGSDHAEVRPHVARDGGSPQAIPDERDLDEQLVDHVSVHGRITAELVEKRRGRSRPDHPGRRVALAAGVEADDDRLEVVIGALAILSSRDGGHDRPGRVAFDRRDHDANREVDACLGECVADVSDLLFGHRDGRERAAFSRIDPGFVGVRAVVQCRRGRLGRLDAE